MASVFAVVLTYNRKDLLRRCLDCIFAQSRACDRVIVIDNCSSDGTSQMLSREWAGRVEVHTLSRNVGASGGFNVGIRVAYQAGAEFVWVMDDDVLPEKDALAKLLDADQYLADKGVARAFVLSTAWTEDGRVTNVPKVDTRPSDRGYENWPSFLDRKLVPVTRATFVSILIATIIFAMMHQDGSGLAAGARFGVLIGLFVVFAFVLHNYVNLNIGLNLALGQAAAYFFQWIVVGIVIGLIYKPLVTR